MEHAAKTLLEQIQINPVIAAVCNEDELKHALNSDCRVVFLLMGNVLDIGELTRRVDRVYTTGTAVVGIAWTDFFSTTRLISPTMTR